MHCDNNHPVEDRHGVHQRFSSVATDTSSLPASHAQSDGNVVAMLLASVGALCCLMFLFWRPDLVASIRTALAPFIWYY